MSWFWLGFALDPALVATADSLTTVSVDYLAVTPALVPGPQRLHCRRHRDRTGEVFDRAGTLENVRFMRQWFGRSLEVGEDHTPLDTLVADIEQRLARAREIGADATGS